MLSVTYLNLTPTISWTAFSIQSRHYKVKGKGPDHLQGVSPTQQHTHLMPFFVFAFHLKLFAIIFYIVRLHMSNETNLAHII